jgi:hypothetical protein
MQHKEKGSLSFEKRLEGVVKKKNSVGQLNLIGFV